MDTICIALSHSIGDQQYERWCTGCDTQMKKCCSKWTDRTTRKTEMELARDVEIRRCEQAQDATSPTPSGSKLSATTKSTSTVQTSTLSTKSSISNLSTTPSASNLNKKPSSSNLSTT